MAQVKGTTTSSSSSTKKKTTTSVASAVKTGATAGTSKSTSSSLSSAVKTGATAGKVNYSLTPRVDTSSVASAIRAGAMAGALTPTTSSYSVVPASTSSYSSPSSSSYSSSSYSIPTVTVPSFSYNPYAESQAVIDARNAMNSHIANKVADWTGGTYGQALNAAMDKILNRDGFSFDLGDTAYDYYKNMYMLNGNMAMQDTMGQAAAMTGGYGSSYATTAGAQAYQGYLQQLNNVIPELWQMAYDKYNNEGQELYNQYGMLSDAYSTEYGQHRDEVNDWQTEADRLTNAFYNTANMDYSRYSDDYDRALAEYQQAVAESQYAQEMALKQAQLQAQLAKASSGSSSSSGSSASTGSSGTSYTPKYTSGDIVEYLATAVTDASGKKLTDTQKVKVLQDAGVSSAEIAAAKKYVAKDKQVADRL